MIDIFALSVPHFVLVIAVLRLMRHDDLDQETDVIAQPAKGERPPRA